MTFLTLMTSAFTVPLYAQTRQQHRKRKQTAEDEKKEKVFSSKSFIFVYLDNLSVQIG